MSSRSRERKVALEARQCFTSMRLPVRTKTTSLTDAELLIFDFLFKYWVPQQFLTRDQYPIHMNCGYSPELTDAELDDTLLRLQAQGLLQQDEDNWGLTPSGGRLWELEREPDWNTYCTESMTREGQLTIHCVDKSIAAAFARTAANAGLYALEPEAVVYSPGDPADLIYWRSFETAWVACCDAEITNDDTNWELYRSQRTWWRCIHELIRKK